MTIHNTTAFLASLPVPAFLTEIDLDYLNAHIVYDSEYKLVLGEKIVKRDISYTGSEKEILLLSHACLRAVREYVGLTETVFLYYLRRSFLDYMLEVTAFLPGGTNE